METFVKNVSVYEMVIAKETTTAFSRLTSQENAKYAVRVNAIGQCNDSTQSDLMPFGKTYSYYAEDRQILLFMHDFLSLGWD